jgi:hypothetical protein
VKIARKNSILELDIQDFISSTILEQFSQQTGLLKPKIDDWRAMVDCVMIDPAYDGKAFKIALSDVPEKKTDLVAGRYALPVPTTVDVKIIDMLGEEVIVTKGHPDQGLINRYPRFPCLPLQHGFARPRSPIRRYSV